jgi:hypothetical protein
MAKPGEVIHDFSKLDQNENFQNFLKWSLENRADEVDIEKCLEGSRIFNRQYVRPLGRQRFAGIK